MLHYNEWSNNVKAPEKALFQWTLGWEMMQGEGGNPNSQTID
jgi:hypothetical protein